MTAFRRNRFLSLASAAIASLCFAGTAAAADAVAPGEVPQVVVDYSDLNLDTERGVQQLQRRLTAAARVVCGASDERNLARAARSRACVEAAIARAVEQVGSPRLAKLQGARSRSLRG